MALNIVTNQLGTLVRLNSKSSFDFLIELKPNKSKEIINLFLNEYGYQGYMHRVDSVVFNDKIRWEKLNIKCKIQKNVLFTKKKILFNN